MTSRNNFKIACVALIAVLMAGMAPAAAADSTLPDFFKDCWSCSFVGQFMQLGDVIAFRIYEFFARNIGSLLATFFGVWCLVQAMRFFVPGTNGLEVLVTLFKRFMVFAAVWAISTQADATYFKEWIYGPVLNVASDGTVSILNEVKSVSGVNIAQVYNLDSATSFSWTGLSTSAAPSDQVNGAIDSIMELLGGMQKITGYGFYAGWKIFSNMSWDLLNWFCRAPAGLILMFTFGIAFVAFPFYVIDLFFRIFLLTTLAPVVVGGFAFGPARQATKAALIGVLQSALTVLMLGIVYVFTASLMASVLTMIPGGGSNFDDFLSWLDNSIEDFSFSQSYYWFLLASGILATSAVAKAKGIIGALIGGFDDGKSMGDKAAGLAAGGMKMAGSVAGGVAGSAALLGGSATLGAIPLGAGKAASAVNGLRFVMNAAAGAPGQALNMLSAQKNLAKAFTPGGMGGGSGAPPNPNNP